MVSFKIACADLTPVKWSMIALTKEIKFSVLMLNIFSKELCRSWIHSYAWKTDRLRMSLTEGKVTIA